MCTYPRARACLSVYTFIARACVCSILCVMCVRISESERQRERVYIYLEVPNLTNVGEDFRLFGQEVFATVQ